MGSPQILDLETLLAPIEGDNPAGVDLREDSSPTSKYYQIKDARSAARAAERSLEADDEPGALPDDWRTILTMAPDLIATESKDLELASWLIEALLRSDGYAGLRDGFRLVKGLVEQYWDGLYPLEDEDGVETKVGPLSGLNGEGADGTLIQPIRKVMITAGSSVGPFAAWHYDQATELSKITDEGKRQARIDAGVVPMDDFERSVAESSAGFYRTMIADLEECLEAFAEMNAILDEKAGSDAPPASNIRNALSTVLDTVKFVSRDMLVASDDEQAEEAGDDGAAMEAAGGEGSASAVVAGKVASREDAFKQLLRVADFFRKTEPHSPVSYTLEELVRRGRLSLPDLLAELIVDESTRRDFLARAGIKPVDNE